MARLIKLLICLAIICQVSLKDFLSNQNKDEILRKIKSYLTNNNDENYLIKDYPQPNIIMSFAALGYCNSKNVFRQNDDNKTLSLEYFRDPAWIYHSGKDFPKQDDFSYNIIYNTVEKTVLLSFAGTKHKTQLLKELLESGGVHMAKYPYHQLMIYFHKLFESTKELFFADLANLLTIINKDDYTFVFSGHSLGGAMASIYLFEVLDQKILQAIKNQSPILITLGQPRTSNYSFSNEINKMAGKVFRIVQEGDIVPDLPPCHLDKNIKCINEYNKDQLDENFMNYDLNSKFYPWKLGGLLVNPYNESSKNQLNDCNNASENVTNCGTEKPMTDGEKLKHFISRHENYFGYHISHECEEASLR